MSKHILDRLRDTGRASRAARFLGIDRRSSETGDRRVFRELRPRDEVAKGGEQRIGPYLKQARLRD